MDQPIIPPSEQAEWPLNDLQQFRPAESKATLVEQFKQDGNKWIPTGEIENYDIFNCFPRIFDLTKRKPTTKYHTKHNKRTGRGGTRRRDEEPINGSAVYHHALPLQNARVDGDPRSHDAPNTNNNNENTPSNDNRVLIGIVSKLSSTVQSLQQNVSGLTGKVNSLLQARSNENTSRIVETPNVYVSAPVESVSNLINHNTTNSSQSWSNVNLQSAYNALKNTRTAPNAAVGSEEQLLNIGNSGNMVRTAHGYSAETLPFVETISPQ
ncbi:unnamed protein product [Mytilus coruscus]|uniref:HSF-type DNA-binding domain-containing protein n=1 Tax=Mytilus coruscus TaxID=42192 RepID=A0A6J8C912_MYTCO|nr:unnamed protein product [Mytilus coruscus]